nr:auxin transport protein BIG [Tanacetum cinerariifolium]
RDSPPMTATYRLQRLRDDLKSNQDQLVAVLNLLMLCCEIQENRRALLRLGALGEQAAMEALCKNFDPYLKNWVEFDQLQKQNLENPKDETVSDIILENGITEVAVRHLKDSFVFTGEASFKSSPKWHSGLKLPSVQLILAMLRGLSMGHLQATSYTSEAIYKTRSSKKAEPLGCSSLDSLYLNCPNLSELNLNSCKALLPE